MGTRTWVIVIPLADGDRVVLEAVEVEGDRERGADLVLAPVAAPDRLRLVVVGGEVRPQPVLEPAGRHRQLLLLGEGQHRHLHRGDVGVEAQHGAGLTAHGLLVVGVDQQRQHDPVHARRRLDDVGDEAPPGHRVEVAEVDPARPLVGREVEVGAVGDALQLPPAEGIEVLDVGGRLGVVGQLLLLVVAQPEVATGAPPAPRRTSGSARRASARTSGRRCPARRRTPSPSARTRGSGRSKLPGEISLRKDLPFCAMPKGIRCRVLVSTGLKSTNMPCAVSGRR